MNRGVKGRLSRPVKAVGRTLTRISDALGGGDRVAALLLAVMLAGGPTHSGRAGAWPSVNFTVEERAWLDHNPEKLTLLFNTEFPPIEFISESGTFVGMGADVMAMVEKRLGVSFLKRPSDDWNRHLAALESGECAIAPTIVRTADRESYAFFTTPYATVPVVIITVRSYGGGLTFDDLEGRRVGVVSGFATEKYVRDRAQGRFEVKTVRNVPEGLRGVSFGQLDALVENLAVAAYYITQEGIPNLRVAGSTDYAFAWSIGVSRKYPLLYSAVQKALDGIPPSELEAVRKHWIALDIHSEMDPETVHILELAALFVVLLLLSLTGITFILKRRLKEHVAVLRESERKYRELVENANSLIIRMDARGHITFFNEFAQRFFGFEEEEIVGRHAVGTILASTDANARELADMMEGIARNPEAYASDERRNTLRSGEEVWIAWTNKPVFDEKGKLREILCVGNDISDRKRAEEALRESEARFRELADLLPQAVYEANAQGMLTYANRYAFELFGYSREDFQKGVEVLQMLAPEDRAAAAQAIAGILGGKAPETDRKYQAVRKDGVSFPVEIYSSPIVHRGRAVGLRGIIIDMTRHAKAEEEKSRLQAQLNQAQKMESVGRLAGGVAHDFNNMLGIIMGNAELVMLKTDSADPLSKNIREILKATRHSTDLVRQLLAFARKQTVKPQILDLNDTVEGMLKMLRRLIGEDIDLAWMPGHDLWQVRIDPSQIDQILANLAVNARDAISGVGKMTIETANVTLDEAYCGEHPGFRSGQYALLSVSDNGVGMSKDVLDHLFEPFFTTKEVGKGTGLGLSSVYGAVKQNGGFINVYSEPGMGTTFKIYLPRFAVEAVETEAGDRPEALQGGTETVLMVEDEAAILKIVRDMLESLGYRVLIAETPQEAIRLAGEHSGPIDLLFTDVVMPEMNGRDLAAQLQGIHPDLKCLYMSGYTANVIAHHGVLDAEVDFIHKPFTMKDLAEKLREVLDKA